MLSFLILSEQIHFDFVRMLLLKGPQMVLKLMTLLIGMLNLAPINHWIGQVLVLSLTSPIAPLNSFVILVLNFDFETLMRHVSNRPFILRTPAAYAHLTINFAIFITLKFLTK